MSDQQRLFCNRLTEVHSDIAEIVRQHIEDNDELLPHMLMADITRYVLADGAARLSIVQLLEDTFPLCDSDVKNLIAVSFVENIESREQMTRALRGVSGTELLNEWERQHSS